MPRTKRYPSHFQAAIDAVPVDVSRLAPRAERIELHLPWPMSTNHLYASIIRGGKVVRVKTQAARDYTKFVGEALVAWRFEHLRRPPAPPYSLIIHAYPPDNGRKHDASNTAKLLEDSIFEGINREADVAVDDSDVEIVYIRKHPPVGKGRVIVALAGRTE